MFAVGTIPAHTCAHEASQPPNPPLDFRRSHPRRARAPLWARRGFAKVERTRVRDRKPIARPVVAKLPRGSKLRWGRQPDPNHALRREVRPEALLRATVALMVTGDVTLLPRHVRKALSKRAKKPARALNKKKTQLALIDTLRRQLGDAKFSQIVGKQAADLFRRA